MALDDFLDAADVDQIRADADDHGARLARSCARDPSPRAFSSRRFVKPDEDRVADHEVADIEFDDFRQRRDRLRGHVIEPVAGVDFKPACCARRAARDALEFRCAARRVAVVTASHQAPV